MSDIPLGPGFPNPFGFDLDQLFRFAIENPWQGGPPMSTSTPPKFFTTPLILSAVPFVRRSIGSIASGTASETATRCKRRWSWFFLSVFT